MILLFNGSTRFTRPSTSLGIIRSRGILSLPKDSPLVNEANSFDRLTTPSANDPELAEGHPERANPSMRPTELALLRASAERSRSTSESERVEGSMLIE